VTYVFECNIIQKHGDEFPTISANMYFLDSLNSRQVQPFENLFIPYAIFLSMVSSVVALLLPCCRLTGHRLLAMVYRSSERNVSIKRISPSVPHQPNSHDCCLYALEFALLLLSHERATIGHLHVSSFPKFQVIPALTNIPKLSIADFRDADYPKSNLAPVSYLCT